MVVDRGIAINLPAALTILPVSDVAAVKGLLLAALTPDITSAILSAFRDSLPELPATGDPVPGWYRNGGSLYEHKA